MRGSIGGHQIGVFGWFLGCTPKVIVARGGVDYYRDREVPDNVLAIIEYETPEGMVRVSYQVLTTTSARGYYESLMGIDGTMNVSENPAKCEILAEGALRIEHLDEPHPWDKFVAQKLLLKKEGPLEPFAENLGEENAKYFRSPPQWLLPVEPEENYHLLHIRNFLDAVRNGTPLNCPAELGYESAVTVLKISEALRTRKCLELKPENFKV